MFARPAASPQRVKSPILFNTVSHEAHGKQRYIEFYAGDICANASDLLITSAFRESRHPTPGTVLASVYERFGVDLTYETMQKIGSGDFLEYFDVDVPRMRIALLYLRSLALRQKPFTEAHLRSALAELRSAMPHLLEEGDSISIPLLGTGKQALAAELVIPVLLDELPGWFEICPQLLVIRVFANDGPGVALISKRINELLNRPLQISDLRRVSLASLCEVEHSVPEFIKSMYAHIRTWVENNESPHKVIAEARLLVETLSTELCRKYECMPEPVMGSKGEMQSPTAARKLAALNAKLRDRSPLVSYLFLLNSLGNMSVHSESWKEVKETDMAAALIGTRRAIERLP